jgi:hypothetical protein
MWIEDNSDATTPHGEIVLLTVFAESIIPVATRHRASVSEFMFAKINTSEFGFHP